MTKVLEERREDVATAMRDLCQAVGKLSAVRDQLVEGLKDHVPGHPDERLALALQRTCETLTLAVGHLPDEFWAIMLMNTVGGEEVRRRVDTMIRNELVLDGYARQRLAVPA